MIKQRPFQTHLKVPRPSVGVDPVRVQPPVFATGIPLPELLIPEGDLKLVNNYILTLEYHLVFALVLFKNDK